ncbi:hypothetical protein GmHk_16G046184 [Glycine max]|nr:hypothetical protein GmHk_16G046184 [Glycine max]
MARLCIPGRGFVLNAEGMPWKLLRRDLSTLAHTWSVLSYSNLASTSHTSNLNLDRAWLVYGLVTRMDMNIGALIAQSNSSRLGFPALITALCTARGVTYNSLSYESLSPTINFAYIKKKFWNLDQPSVYFPRTREARAKAAEIPSSSTPRVPPVPTSTPPPASAHLGPSIDVAWPRAQPSPIGGDPGPTLEETQEATTPEITPQQAAEPSTSVLDLSSPQPSQEPSTRVLGLSSPTTSPAGTPMLHLTDEEEDIMDQD